MVLPQYFSLVANRRQDEPQGKFHFALLEWNSLVVRWRGSRAIRGGSALIIDFMRNLVGALAGRICIAVEQQVRASAVNSCSTEFREAIQTLCAPRGPQRIRIIPHQICLSGCYCHEFHEPSAVPESRRNLVVPSSTRGVARQNKIAGKKLKNQQNYVNLSLSWFYTQYTLLNSPVDWLGIYYIST